jgi:NADH dehydrogenase
MAMDRAPDGPHVVIVGGGFAGLQAAKSLRQAAIRVTIIDRRNHHLFQPLLYQVATAALSPGNIAAPIRAVVRRLRNVHVVLGEVVGVDLAAQQVRLADGEAIDYDVLVLAAGSQTGYFGNDRWAPVAPGLKSIDDALEIRRRVLMAFELAERTPDATERARLMTFVVVGGGPTGVELAGALAEIARHTMRGDFRAIDTTSAQVLLIEAGPRVLATFPPSLSASAERQLVHLGVAVRTGAKVTDVTSAGLQLDGGEQIEAATVLWAAGVAAVPLATTLGVPVDRAGRIAVEPDLRLAGHTNVYVAGDLAAVSDRDGRLVPGVAPAAMQAGQSVAANIQRQLRGEPTHAFHYRNKGNLATIGRASGVADFGLVRLAGLPAWLMWLVVHIWFLIGFDNRLLVFAQWAWSYLTFQRGARLITGDAQIALRPGAAGEALLPAPSHPAPTVAPAEQSADQHLDQADIIQPRSDGHARP